ncbi:hypothetical protein NPIL_285111 [Nephila pilipes]|uniref:Uncharacterized protein n=1 Tax=Nephila pilipes TaxID=299642 RepID=A0A8X6PE72_NEPPI|nr:hypothetical protein NPIL_285111 [Nephila pilipes]
MGNPKIDRSLRSDAYHNGNQNNCTDGTRWMRVRKKNKSLSRLLFVLYVRNQASGFVSSRKGYATVDSSAVKYFYAMSKERKEAVSKMGLWRREVGSISFGDLPGY